MKSALAKVMDRAAPEAPRRFFILESAELGAAARKYEEAFYDAHDAREALCKKYAASAFIGTDAGILALQFAGKAPEGWVRNPHLQGVYLPDLSSAKGIEAARDLYNPALTYPQAFDVVRKMGLDIVKTDGYAAITPGVEVFDGQYVATVPAGFLAPNTMIAGAREISLAEYTRLRTEALTRPEPQPEASRRARPR
jgi:hypothetical protein